VFFAEQILSFLSFLKLSFFFLFPGSFVAVVDKLLGESENDCDTTEQSESSIVTCSNANGSGEEESKTHSNSVHNNLNVSYVVVDMGFGVKMALG
jgi:hypothetical protein